jgi:hypothetical protein
MLKKPTVKNNSSRLSKKVEGKTYLAFPVNYPAPWARGILNIQLKRRFKFYSS